MDPLLIAKVLLTKNNGKRSIGTGYPISKNLVMTARHVVISPKRDFDKPIVIEWPDITDDLGKPYTTKVTKIAYNGEDQYDIVLLECTTPSQTPTSPLLPSQHIPDENNRWKSHGYAEIGKEEVLNTRKKIPASGLFLPIDPNSHEISLYSNSDALKKTGWRGFSGAPVFQGDDLCAVITGTPTKRKECFTAVFIPYLLKIDPRFFKAVSFEQLKPSLDAFITYLDGKPDTQKALFEQVRLYQNKIENLSAPIVTFLVNLDAFELINIIHQAQRIIQKRLIKQELGQVLKLALPLLYDRLNEVSLIRAGIGNASDFIRKIPYATDISAEILMASADKRPADFKVIDYDGRKQVRSGKYRLPLPPESGPDDGKQQLQDIQHDLYNRWAHNRNMNDIKLAFEDRLFNTIAFKQHREYSPEDQRFLSQRALRRDAKVNRPGYYWLWNISRDTPEWEKLLVLAKQLKDRYPQVTLLSLAYDVNKQADEEDLFVLLADTQSTD